MKLNAIFDAIDQVECDVPGESNASRYYSWRFESSTQGTFKFINDALEIRSCARYVIKKLKADRISGSFNTEGTHLNPPANSHQIKQAYITIRSNIDSRTLPADQVAFALSFLPQLPYITLVGFEWLCERLGRKVKWSIACDTTHHEQDHCKS